MTATVRRRILIALLAGAFVPCVQAITYRQWLSASPEGVAPVTVTLEPISNGQVRATERVVSNLIDRKKKSVASCFWNVPMRPSGGYLGQVVFRNPGEGRIQYPLQATFSYVCVAQDDLVIPQDAKQAGDEHGPKLQWHRPMGLVRPEAQVGHELYRRTFQLDNWGQGRGATLPMVLPYMNRQFTMFGGQDNLITCLCEIRDAAGTILARKQLIELFAAAYDNNQDTGWVMDETEADHTLREACGIQSSIIIQKLPPAISSFAEINALWAAAGAPGLGLGRDLIRRLLLMGIWIYGREETVTNLTELAGLPRPGAVLMGGLQSPIGTNALLPHVHHASRDNRFWEATPSGDANAVPIMENRRDLFQPFKHIYIGWTLGVLGVFVLLGAIGMPLAFGLLKGSRRIILWWLVPAVTVLMAALAFVGGKLVLPHRAQSDLTEYRLAYAGWPEYYCHSVNRLLLFEERQAAWAMPEGGFVIPSCQFQFKLMRGYALDLFEQQKSQSLRRLYGIQRGQIVIDETAWFQAGPVPVAVSWKNSLPQLKARTALHNVFVWEKGTWHMVGNLKAGQSTNLPTLKTGAIDHIGLPSRIREAIPTYQVQTNVCKNCGKVHGVDKATAATFSNSWVVVAMDAGQDDLPGITCAVPGVQSEKRVAWIVQLPLDNPGAKPSANEGEETP